MLHRFTDNTVGANTYLVWDDETKEGFILDLAVPPQIVRAYVLTAAKNAALNMLPKRQQQNELLSISELDIADDHNLFDQIAASQDYELLFKAIRKLPAIYREVLMLKYVQELTMKEIAALLDRKVTTIHQQITRGKKLLIAQCREEGMDFAKEAV